MAGLTLSASSHVVQSGCCKRLEGPALHPTQRPFVTELSRRWGYKVGVSAILAFEMAFDDVNDTMSYPTLPNSAGKLYI